MSSLPNASQSRPTHESPLASPLEQWLGWEQQANLRGFRASSAAAPLELAAVARDRVLVRRSAASYPALEAHFLRGDQVLFPRHPLNRDTTIPFWSEPAADTWQCRFTSSRTVVPVLARGEALFSLKLPTDHPHPDFRQPEKTKLREEIVDALAWSERVGRVDARLGPDPVLRIARDAFAVLVPETECGFLVRDLRLFEDGHHYLPALSIPFVGRALAERHGISFAAYWAQHYAAASGRAKARLLLRYGLQYETPNPQNLLVQLDASMRPTGRIALRDLGDANCAADLHSRRGLPWRRLASAIRVETANSFWAFDEAGELSVDAATLASWRDVHELAYFGELALALPGLAPSRALCGTAATAHWSEALGSRYAEPGLALAFARWAHRSVHAAEACAA